jgi:hypothetical protein
VPLTRSTHNAIRCLPHQARRLARWQMQLRFQSQPLPRKLMGVGTPLQKPPGRSKTKNPPAGDASVGSIEFLRRRPGVGRRHPAKQNIQEPDRKRSVAPAEPVLPHDVAIMVQIGHFAPQSNPNIPQ